LTVAPLGLGAPTKCPRFSQFARHSHWWQSILFSNGWEVNLHFRAVRVEEADALLPAPRNGAVTSRQAEPQPA